MMPHSVVSIKTVGFCRATDRTRSVVSVFAGLSLLVTAACSSKLAGRWEKSRTEHIEISSNGQVVAHLKGLIDERAQNHLGYGGGAMTPWSADGGGAKYLPGCWAVYNAKPGPWLPVIQGKQFQVSLQNVAATPDCLRVTENDPTPWMEIDYSINASSRPGAGGSFDVFVSATEKDGKGQVDVVLFSLEKTNSGLVLTPGRLPGAGIDFYRGLPVAHIFAAADKR